MLGPLLGGWLLQVAGFSTAFVTAGTLGVIAVVLFFLMRLPPVPGRVNRETLNVKRGESDDSRITNNAVRPPGAAAVLGHAARPARTGFGYVRVLVARGTDRARPVAHRT